MMVICSANILAKATSLLLLNIIAEIAWDQLDVFTNLD